MNIAMSLGECPFCGDELVLMKTISMNRMVKCLNSKCPKKFAYGIPKKGRIEITGSLCPKSKIPIIVIVPQLKVNSGRIRVESEKTYCWTQGPCFSCKGFRTCEIHLDILEEFGGSIEMKKVV